MNVIEAEELMMDILRREAAEDLGPEAPEQAVEEEAHRRYWEGDGPAPPPMTPEQKAAARAEHEADVERYKKWRKTHGAWGMPPTGADAEEAGR